MYGGSILWEFSMLVCSWAYRTTHIVFSWFALVALEKKVEFTDYYLSSSKSLESSLEYDHGMVES